MSPNVANDVRGFDTSSNFTALICLNYFINLNAGSPLGTQEREFYATSSNFITSNAGE